MEKSSRKYDLDVIRVLAIIFVLTVHAMNYIGYYSIPNEGVLMYILSIVRVLVVTCVPLFLLLSGYLCVKEQKLDKKYLMKLVKLLIIYLICGIICSIFDVIVNGDKSVFDVILSFFSFTAAPYGWYVAMYIGLFLLIPFLNRLWEKLNVKEQRLLVLVLFLLVIVPSFFNNFNFAAEKWWHGTRDEYSMLYPADWVYFYPIAYYVLGRAIRDGIFKSFTRLFSKKICLLFSLLVLLVTFGTLNYVCAYQETFMWTNRTAYNGYQCFIISILLFGLCLNCKCEKRILRNAIKSISKYSFGMYLISYVFDMSMQRIMYVNGLFFSDKVAILPACIIGVLICSWIVSFGVTKIIDYFF